MTAPGYLIVLEGPDGVGKSTLSGALRARLTEVGLPSRAYAFPGNEPGTLGSLVYRLHHEADSVGIRAVSPTAIQTMHIAAHLDAIERVFRPRLEAGETIVLDRYWWSTAVYGAVTGVSRDVLADLISAERRYWGAIQPIVLFLIDRTRPWRSTEHTPAWDQLAREYRDLASKERAQYRVEVIANDAEPQSVVRGMVDTVLALIRAADRKIEGAGSGVDQQLTLNLSDSARWLHTSPAQMSVGRIKGLKSTPVFDTYWRFAVERQRAYFRRLEGASPPWSTDPILQRHRFTNAYRASDRVSQYLIRHVIYRGDQQPEEVFFRTILFKLFNRIETWELLERSLGGLHAAEFDPGHYGRLLDRVMEAGQSIYSGAYIMPAAPGGQGRAKHSGHLMLLQRMLRDNLPRRLADTRSLRDAFELLRAYPMMGDFLAFQYIIDLNYSTLLNFSEMEFIVPGPGARSGLRKCFPELAGLSEADVIRLVTESQHDEFARRGLLFRDLWGRPLQLIDCQNLFCEVDKYARVAHPECTQEGGRTRIKQVFRPAGRPPRPWYPPKWGLNARIGHDIEDANALDRG